MSAGADNMSTACNLCAGGRGVCMSVLGTPLVDDQKDADWSVV